MKTEIPATGIASTSIMRVRRGPVQYLRSTDNNSIGNASVLKSGRAYLAWAWTGIILLLCLAPAGWFPENSSPKTPHVDKVVHFAMFFLFAFLWRRAVPETGRGWRVLVWGLVLAIATELAQGTPFIRRDADPFDALADILGVLAGLAAYRTFIQARRITNRANATIDD